MLKAKAAPVGPVRHGRLTEFLRRDLFSVKLDNGVTITAVMPEELSSIYDPNVSLGSDRPGSPLRRKCENRRRSRGLLRHTRARSLDDGKGRPTAEADDA